MHPLISIIIDGKELKDTVLRMVSIETFREGIVLCLTAKPEPVKTPAVERAEVWR